MATHELLGYFCTKNEQETFWSIGKPPSPNRSMDSCQYCGLLVIFKTHKILLQSTLSQFTWTFVYSVDSPGYIFRPAHPVLNLLLFTFRHSLEPPQKPYLHSSLSQIDLRATHLLPTHSSANAPKLNASPKRSALSLSNRCRNHQF